MSETINWLHFSDLHFGLDPQGWMWPRVKTEILRDVERLIGTFGGLDLIIFTGDFVQKGDPKEYDALNRELEAVWKVFAKYGRVPQLCAIPGNHDIKRPSLDSAVTKALTKLWHLDEDLRSKFWKDPDCEYRVAVREHFKPFTDWLQSVPVPQMHVTSGILPGDFSGVIKKGEVSLGVVGLNTTFLQICDGLGKGTLDVHVSQLNAICGGTPDEWVQSKTANILLTHQPMDWLSRLGQDHFKEEIYVPGRFFAHYCGHQHEPDTHELSQAGSIPRRTRQAPSLFGLEYFANGTRERIHGYNAGQFIFNNNQAYEQLWPRIGIKARHGGFHIVPDHTYVLNENNFTSTPLDFHENHTDKLTIAQVVAVPDNEEVQLFEDSFDKAKTLEKLTFCPRLTLKAGPHHQQVRLDEQSECEHELRRSSIVWVVADWGAGQEGFLASVVERLKSQNKKPDAFLLKCEEASDVDALEALFPQQFGMPMQAFCHHVGIITDSILILDGLHPNFSTGKSFVDFQRICTAIIDYCEGLRLIIVSRLPPPADTIGTVTLNPLDAPNVRTYVLSHPNSSAEVEDAEAIEKLRDLSEGLPMHLDRLLKSLDVASLSSIIQAEAERISSPTEIEAPPSLIHTVNRLATSEDRRTKRSYRLLQVLTILPYGETLEWLHHFLPTEPFFFDNAIQLKEMALLEVVPLQKTDIQAKSNAAGFDDKSPKLLKVPKQVRDYIQTLLSSEERLEILLAGVAHFCGRNWKEGKVKLRTLPIEYREYLGSGAGNEFALIQQLMGYARDFKNDKLIEKVAELGVKYTKHLESSQRFRDLAIVSGALGRLLNRDEHPKEWSRLNASYGQSLRMTGKPEESLIHLRESLEISGSNLTGSEKCMIWLNISLAEKHLGNKDNAITAANEVINNSKTGDTHLHAQTVLAELKLKGGEKNKRLAELEKEARQQGHVSTANNIAIDFASAAGTPNAKIQHLDRVLRSDGLLYNRVRAIISKSEAINSMETELTLTQQEQLLLSGAYSYLHSQRFNSLFDRCHEQLWILFETKNASGHLFRLFRHSSFIWRVRGETEKEETFLRRLETSESDTSHAIQIKTPTIMMEVGYFLKRLELLIKHTLTA